MFMKKFLASYSEKHREPFNEALFVRSEDDIIEDVKKVIISISNNNDDVGPLIIRVNYFNVIKDYRKVKEILHVLENKENRRNKRLDYNIHDFINLKDSDIVLLEVNYHVEVNGVAKDASVYIDIPKVINKYYFKISGTIYSTLYQIADASTYNNSQSKSKDRSITFRQIFQKHEVYEKNMKLDGFIVTLDGEEAVTVPCTLYNTNLFGNNIPVCKYALAEFGMVKAMDYLYLSDIYISLDKPYINNANGDFIYFNKDNVFISTPLYLWNNCPVFQSFIYTVLLNVKKCDNLENIFSKDYWLMMLGTDFKNKSIEKGQNMLDSMKRNYEYSMIEDLRLPMDNKRNLLDILRWQMYEFNALYLKDNYDMTYKKIRISSYIAGFYAAKLSKNLINVVNSIKSLTADKLIKALNIEHTFITDSLKNSNLVSYKNDVNDDDIFSVLKYTFKGTSGIGENKASAVPVKYRLANASHIGKVDCDTSPAGDPGMTGLLCPYANIYKGNYLAEYKEPCSWKEVQQSVMDDYRKIYSMSSIFQTREELMGTSEGRALLETLEGKIKNITDYTVGTNIEME